MRALTVAALLLGVGTQHTVAEDAPVCTTEAAAKYYTQFDMECDQILDDFQTCSSDCLTKMNAIVPVAPNCASSEKATSTLRQRAENKLKDCEAAQANATSRYSPRLSPGVQECDLVEVKEWRKKYGNGTDFFDCYVNAKAGSSCSDDCLKVLEEGVEAAPMCSLSTGGNLTFFESEKRGLANCVIVRGESVMSNAVLQSTTSESNDASMGPSEGTVRPRWTLPPRTRANLTTPTPSATTASGTSSASICFAAIFASVAATLIAVL